MSTFTPTADTAPEPAAIRAHSGVVGFTAVAALILGVAAIVFPFAASVGVTVAIGAMLVAFGVVEGVRAFRLRGRLRTLGTALFGLLATVTGLLMLFFPGAGLFSLTLLLIAYFLAGGACRIADAWRLRPVRGWGLVAASGALSVLLGLVLFLAMPLSALWSLGVLFGIDLIGLGVAQLALLRWARRAAPAAS
jgi:uncharacterized membrane protein HdeD (DUF308 family)